MLITEGPTGPSPEVEPHLAGKAKKPLFHKLFTGGASFALLFIPVISDINPLGLFEALFSSTAQKTSAASLGYNSQTVPLLASARNLNPSPSTGGGDIAVVDGSALLPQEGPSGTAADIEERPHSTQISVYIVRKGDTLSEIAELFGVSVNTIVWANDIKNGVIHEGDSLVILPITGVRHTVVKGETLSSIATKYKSDAGEIAQFNDLALGATLAAGDVVVIPDGEIAAPAPTRSSTPTAPLRGSGGPALAGYYAWPVDGGIVTQGLHGYNGIDIGARTGTEIFAAAAGTVIIARSGGYNGGYGSYVVVQHDNGTQTLYAHASRVLVSVGQQVGQGQTIAAVGSTGKVTGSHLHFEVRGAANPFAK